ncbi:MAG: hypothetical protein MHPSP_000791 [Paramarteilia canceri]
MASCTGLCMWRNINKVCPKIICFGTIIWIALVISKKIPVNINVMFDSDIESDFGQSEEIDIRLEENSDILKDTKSDSLDNIESNDNADSQQSSPKNSNPNLNINSQSDANKAKCKIGTRIIHCSCHYPGIIKTINNDRYCINMAKCQEIFSTCHSPSKLLEPLEGSECPRCENDEAICKFGLLYDKCKCNGVIMSHSAENSDLKYCIPNKCGIESGKLCEEGFEFIKLNEDSCPQCNKKAFSAKLLGIVSGSVIGVVLIVIVIIMIVYMSKKDSSRNNYNGQNETEAFSVHQDEYHIIKGNN